MKKNIETSKIIFFGSGFGYRCEVGPFSERHLNSLIVGNSRIRFKSCHAYRFAETLAHGPMPILAVVLPPDAKSKMLCEIV